MTSQRRWEVNTTATFSSTRPRRNVNRLPTCAFSSAAVGSSRMRSFGRAAIAFAISTICISPGLSSESNRFRSSPGMSLSRISRAISFARASLRNGPLRCSPPKHDVLPDGEVGDEAQVLEDHGDPVLPRLVRGAVAHHPVVVPDLARVGVVDAGDDLGDRALARAVRAEQAGDAARAAGEVPIGQGDDSSEPLPDSRGFQNRHAVDLSWKMRGAGRAPAPSLGNERIAPYGARAYLKSASAVACGMTSLSR